MKKILVGALSLGLIFAGGIAVSADSGNSTSNGNGLFNFGQMSKIMENSDWSIEDIKNMYNTMHGTNGAAPSANFEQMSNVYMQMSNTNEALFEQMQQLMGNLSEEDYDTMAEFMQNFDGTINYGQMKDMMEQIHPELSKEQIKDMYNAMHGTNGAAPSTNFRGMSSGMNNPM